MACVDEDVLPYLDEGVLTCLDNNDKDNFSVYFLHAHPLEYIFEETLGVQCSVHHNYMHKIGWCDTYDHFLYQHYYENQTI